MKLTLLTYNTLFNQALANLKKIINKYHPDIICLQEVDTKDENILVIKNNGYQLAEYANCFFEFGKIWGIATFYNPEKFELIHSESIPLINGFYELIKQIINLLGINKIKRTVIKTTFKAKDNHKLISVYNLHLSALGLTNLRIKQLNKIYFDEISNKGSLIICGDFNFPIERRKLEKIMNKHKLKEATYNISYTIKFSRLLKKYHKYNFVLRFFIKILKKLTKDKAKLDYIFYRNLKHLKTERLNYSFSDHYPLLAEFELS